MSGFCHFLIVYRFVFCLLVLVHPVLFWFVNVSVIIRSLANGFLFCFVFAMLPLTSLCYPLILFVFAFQLFCI